MPSSIDDVILLDSDSFIKNPEAISDVVRELHEDENLAGGVFSLKPEGTGFLKTIQDVEYAISQGLRKFTSQIGKIRCAAGAGAIYKRPVLEEALENHSGEFVGDDFELTTIVQGKGYDMKLFPQVEVGTYVPETWKEKVLQVEKWVRGGWRVWAEKHSELGKQLATPDRFAFTLGMELTAPLTLASTVYGMIESAQHFGFNNIYLASTAGWTAVNAGIAAYGGADKKTMAKTILLSPLWLPLVLTTYLPATVLAAARSIKPKLNFKRRNL